MTKAMTKSMYSLRPFQHPLKSFVYNFRKLFHPSWFQGNLEREKYFEGWYFKNVNAGEDHVWSFIPGISLVRGNTHAFVQAINGQSGETLYFRFPAEDFMFSSDGFEVRIADNYFSEVRIVLRLGDGKNMFEGELHFHDRTTYPVKISRPGIMGWYRYVPFMECYHGVVSLDHGITGSLTHNHKQIVFDGGRGYIEKDWGSSMPRSWIWMQTNHFEQPGTSFMLSVARIPWIGKTFTGFLGFFLHKGKIISFATYTGAVINDLSFTESEVKLFIKAGKYNLEIEARKAQHENRKPGRGGLKAPVFGNMERTIHESIDATIQVRVLDRSGKELFAGTGRNSGFEMVDDLNLLKE
jgi:tocopherol cyclase